jgi:hypothetical protein
LKQERLARISTRLAAEGRDTKMKRLLLAGTAFLALATAGPVAYAQRVDFTYTGAIVTFTVPTTGLYQIVAFGAQGGSGPSRPTGGPSPYTGGLGAEIGGDFSLTAGETLQIAVGGAGMNLEGGSGGGGGSFVVGPGNTPLVIAGGGGGGYLGLGQGGLTGPDGGNGGAGLNGGGTGGNGGGGGLSTGRSSGGGGGGFFSVGGNGKMPGNVGTGGGAFPELTGGVFGGGFGGGGGGIASATGGGGGYSGGGGSYALPGGVPSGGGGGSFDAGTDQILIADWQSGNGEVVISVVFAGTPGTPNCHGMVVSTLAKQYGGLDAAAAALGYSSVQVLQNAIRVFCVG